MQRLLDTMFRLVTSGDTTRLLNFIVSNRHRYSANKVIIALERLLDSTLITTAHGMRAAFLVATLLDRSGARRPTISLTLSVGGLLFGKPNAHRRGLQMLRAQRGAEGIDKRLLSTVVGDRSTVYTGRVSCG